MAYNNKSYDFDVWREIFLFCFILARPSAAAKKASGVRLQPEIDWCVMDQISKRYFQCFPFLTDA
jgi:hypothetical protein